MKKVLFAVAAVAVIGLSSCKECVDCSGVAGQSGTKICKSDYDSAGTGLSWDTYKAALKVAGCK
ncbi:MAG: hypothetical protein WBO46_10325 [Caldilineaceae bacterium]|jgi:hypothetical protein